MSVDTSEASGARSGTTGPDAAGSSDPAGSGHAAGAGNAAGAGQTVGAGNSADVLASLVHLIRTTRSIAHRQTDELVIAGTPLGILKKLGVGDARPSDLACVLQIAPSVVSRAIVPLEKAGLVERRPDPADARAWHLTLTELGRQRLRARQSYINDQFAGIFVDWEPSDVAQLASLMHRLDLGLAERSDDLLPHFPLTHQPDQTQPDQTQPVQATSDRTGPDQTEGLA